MGDDALRELAELEELVRQEHKGFEASAGNAHRSVAEVQAEQEDERRKWRLTCETHEELRRQLEVSAQECELAQADRDAARSTCHVVREELHDVRRDHTRLAADHGRAETELAAKHEQRLALEEEI